MTEPSQEKNRIVFLDHLRGLACLMVVFGHVYLMGINDPRTVGVWLPFLDGPIFGPDSPGLNPFNRMSTWLVLEAGITFGGLGVAIFFLISGYIILRTVDRESPVRFLVRRAFRIYPMALVVAAGVAIVTAWLVSRAGGASPHSVGSVLATGFALPGIVGTFSTIPVIWSLQIEVFFYITMAVLAAVLPRIEVRHLAVVAAVFVAASTVTQLPAVRASVQGKPMGAMVTLGYCAFHSCFLFIGSALYRAEQAGFSRRSVRDVLLMLGIFAIAVGLSLDWGDFASTGAAVQSLVAAVAIFVAGMLHGMRSRAIRWFTFFGDVSYPLYLLHIPAAWVLMFLFSRLGVGMNTATIASLAIVVALSWVLHKAIEMPVHNFGRALTRAREKIR